MSLTFYPEGTTALPSDDKMRSLHKLVALGASGGGSSFTGSGSPEGVVTATEGKLYVDQATTPPSLWAKASGTGNTGWVILIEGV